MGREQQLSVQQYIIAASVGGTFTSFFVTPFDVIKTRLQAHQKREPITSLAMTSRIVRKEGLLALWRGLNQTLLMTVPATAFYFTIYEECKRFANQRVNNPIFPAAFAGLIARSLTVCVISPVELIRTVNQASSAEVKFSSGMHLVRSVVASHGILGLWAGLLPTLVRDVPFSIIYWTSYETLKAKLSYLESPFIQSFIGGLIGGSLAAFITLPFDVIKTRRQMTMNGVHNTVKPLSLIIREIIQNEGYPTFFRGIVPRLIKVAPSCSIMISAYEIFKIYIFESNKQSP